MVDITMKDAFSMLVLEAIARIGHGTMSFYGDDSLDNVLKVYLIEKKLVGLDEGYSPATRMYLSQKGIEVYSQLVDVVNKQIGGQ